MQSPHPEIHWAHGVPMTPISPGVALSPMSGHSSPTSVGVIRYMLSENLKTTRKAERRGGSSKIGSKYRGVTHHARTNRFESHIWDDGKQVYLGGFYNEIQAALAYDLAATRFRGDDAVLNFGKDISSHEYDCRNSVTQQQVVICLREQSKAMNKVDQSKMFSTDPWELQLSHTINPAKQHIGVFGSEVEAARAYDRALIKSLGVEAAPLLNFQLVDYLDILSNCQISEGMRKGLIPSVIPQSFSPSMPPTPIYTVECSQANSHQNVTSELGSPVDQTTPTVMRRTSNTPRSVLESQDGSDEPEDEAVEVGIKRSNSVNLTKVQTSKTEDCEDESGDEEDAEGNKKEVRCSKRLRRQPPSADCLPL